MTEEKKRGKALDEMLGGKVLSPGGARARGHAGGRVQQRSGCSGRTESLTLKPEHPVTPRGHDDRRYERSYVGEPDNR